MNVKIIPYLFRIVTLVLVGAGFYYVGSESGYNEAITEISKESSLIVDKVRKEQEIAHAKHLNEVAKYERVQRQELSKMSELRTRLRKATTRRVNQVDGSLCNVPDSVNADVVRVFESAIDSESLPRETSITESTAEKEPVAEYLLRCISSYNSCAIQLNALIDTE